MSIKTEKTGTETFDIVNYSPYFTGINTLKVLTGTDGTKQQLQEIIYNNGGLKNYSEYYDEDDNPDWKNKVPLVLGLPVNVIERGKPELSHIELRNSFMSHQPYQNWAILMEAELAVLKDIGYTKVELRDYFGKSYYLNNITDVFSTGYGAWNGTAYSGYSNIMNGVGLHIYGNENTITQTGDTLSSGRYSIGTRIDGVENNYQLYGSKIDMQGADSIGIAVAWGKEHNIIIEEDTTTDPPNVFASQVIASSENGIGVSFDFGKNVCGGMADDRGSYSAYSMELQKNVTPDIDTQEELVSNFNVTGSSIEGKKAAIYISENAHVENININNSTITGDIISKWNSVQSGANMYVQRKDSEGKWYPVNKDRIEDIYFTNINFSDNTNVDGNINGSNEIFNTLNVSNSGDLDFQGDEMNINQLTNTGTIDFTSTKAIELTLQSGLIEGNTGTLNFNSGVNLANISSIKNTVNIATGTFLSLVDGTENKKIDIKQLNAKDVDLYIDYGDSFILKEASDPSKKNLILKQILVDQKNADSLETTDSVTLFEAEGITPAKTLDVSSQANFYYNGKKHTFAQDTSTEANKVYLKISHDKTQKYELADAIGDSSTGNYIVGIDEDITKNLGTIHGNYFEISGDEIDVAGHTGLVVDGDYNNKTVLKTDIYGASDSNITLLNEANMLVEAKDDIQIGKKGETSLSINDSTFEADLENRNITFGGEIKGSGTNTKNFVILGAKNINLDSVDNVVMATKAETTNLNNTMTNTYWQIEGKNTNILNDSYLSSDGTNTIVYIEGLLNLANNKASDINLSSMKLNSNMDTKIDIDLASLSADKFVFNDSDDLVTNGYALNINDLNITNQKTALTDETYPIPFVSPTYNNENFLGGVRVDEVQDIMTPIFKYNMDYVEDPTLNQGAFVLSRGATKDYNSYNPSVLAGPVAAQLGGYLTQLNSYDEAFKNMDTYMMMPSSVRTAMKMRNKIAASEGAQYDDTKSMYDYAGGWFRPYTTFEKVGLKNGPKVGNISYGSYVGGESSLTDLGHGWDGMWGAYVGYNGSHQTYNGIGVYQNGGTLGLTGMAYKNNYFLGGTINVGANAGDASTMYGREDFAMLMSGVALKTGYNWELAKGKFIVQPSLQSSYSFVNTFDYTNAAGVKIKSDPLHAISIEPGVKFIGNLKNSWQPYAGVSFVYNILDRTRFKANDVSLPNFSIKPFVKYGVGVRKTWGERFTGYFQTYITNGGRNGIGLSAGLRWTIGKK